MFQLIAKQNFVIGYTQWRERSGRGDTSTEL